MKISVNCTEQEQQLSFVSIFTARRSYASAVLGVVILSVCPSVCPSVTRVLYDQSKEATGYIFIPHERAILSQM